MYLLFDIGGTKTRLAFSEDGKTFESPEIFPTSENFDEGIQFFKKTAEKVVKGREVKVIAGGIAGSLSKDKKETVVLPNLPGWQKKPLAKELQDAFSVPVLLENDAALAALGEAIHGAGKGFEIVSYLTVGTGVGGAKVVNGKIDANRFGFEPGHQIVDFEEANCAYCKNKGELENYIAGHSLKEKFNKNPKDIEDEKVWGEVARILAYGVNNAIVFWSPDVVVLGGSILNKPGISVEKVGKHLKDILKIFPEHPELKHSSLGDLGGIYGALEYVNQNLNNK